MPITTLQRLEGRKRAALDALDGLREKGGGTLMGLTDPADIARAKALNEEMAALVHEQDMTPDYAKFGGRPPGATGPHTVAKDVTVLDRDDSFAAWAKARRGYRPGEEGLSLGKFLRGLATGDWDGAEAELKGMTEGVLADGGHMVPTPLSDEVIDLARAEGRVFQAGARTVPMTSQTLKLARQTGDPTASWHTEATADISDSQITLDAVTLTARTLPVLVKLSLELFEDAPNVERQVQASIAAAIALELDRVALYGTGTAPQPRGLKNQTGVDETILGGANGAAPLDYDFIVDAIGRVRNANHEPTAAIDAPRTETSLAKLKDTTEQPLRPPQVVENLPRLSTNQVPTNLTVGTSNDTSDMFVGDWRELLIGMRTSLSIQFLRERYLADTGEFAFFAYLRADVAVARPAAFEIVTGIRP